MMHWQMEVRWEFNGKAADESWVSCFAWTASLTQHSLAFCGLREHGLTAFEVPS